MRGTGLVSFEGERERIRPSSHMTQLGLKKGPGGDDQIPPNISEEKRERKKEGRKVATFSYDLGERKSESILGKKEKGRYLDSHLPHNFSRDEGKGKTGRLCSEGLEQGRGKRGKD